MAPSRRNLEPAFIVTPLKKNLQEKHNFGALIEGVDLEDINGETLCTVSKDPISDLNRL